MTASRRKTFDLFRRQRNRVKSLVRSARNAYFDKLVETGRSTSTICKAISEITNKSNRKTNNTTPSIAPKLFKTLFFLISAETSAQSSGCTTDNLTDTDQSISPESLALPCTVELLMYIYNLSIE